LAISLLGKRIRHPLHGKLFRVENTEAAVKVKLVADFLNWETHKYSAPANVSYASSPYLNYSANHLDPTLTSAHKYT
jgi:hypothetical protein